MITFQEAYDRVIEEKLTLNTEQIPFQSALGRILAEDIVSDMDMPPFNKSAMDGYACRREDITNELSIIETIPAGHIPQREVKKNTCSKIMTGAVIPDGADCVIIIEKTTETSTDKIRFMDDNTSDNICIKGEDIKEGSIVINKNTIIKPQHIAVMASVGCVKPLVVSQPTVGIISTGSELVEPSEKAQGAKIRNSNAYQLAAQLKFMGIDAKNYGAVQDSDEAIYSVLKKAMDENQIVLLSGGVSMGDFDLVPGILKKLNLDIKFDRIAVKPGKPTTFASSENNIVFGLPGNPVSVFVIFELLVKPFIYHSMLYDYSPKIVPMVLTETISRKRTERQSFLPVAITKNTEVIPIPYHGSAHINAMCSSAGLISIPAGIKEIKKGQTIDVRQI
ncbi:MAG: molybdopterin molybdotransferase MoeA [Spirochaetes bacterium]|nr:molybdopterin molybdotransferase MoeA [Spirochaetota bacterium]